MRLLKIDYKDICKLFSTYFVIGIIVHLVIIVNLYHNHDSIALPYNNGEWLLAQGKWIVTPFSSIEGPMDIPYISALIGLFFYALSAVIYIKEFNILNPIIQLVIGVAFVSFPSVATCIIYHGADYFGCVFFLAVLGSILIIRGGIFSLIGVCLVSISMGGYQANISTVSIMLLSDVLLRMSDDKEDLKKVLIRTCKYIASIAMSCVLYYLVLKIRLFFAGTQLSDYKGISSMSQNLHPNTLLRSALGAYSDFINFFTKNSLGIHGSSKLFVPGIILITLGIAAYIFLLRINGSLPISRIVLGFVFLILGVPLCSNAVGILSANSSWYNITANSLCVAFVLPVLLADRIEQGKKNNIHIGVVVMLMIISIYMCGFYSISNNVVYYKLALINSEYDAKIPALISRIQCLDGYHDGIKIVIVGDTPYAFLSAEGSLEAFDNTFDTLGYGLGKSYDEVYCDGVIYCLVHNKYSLNIFFESANNVQLDKKDIDNMPVYPEKGSIKEMDDIIVVKLGTTNN